MEQTRLWETVLAELRLSLSKANFQTWLKGKTEIVSVQNGLIEIGCQNAYIADWVEQRYYQQIKLSLERLLGQQASLVFVVSPIAATITAKTKVDPDQNKVPLFVETATSSLQENLSQASINPVYTFENFVVGKSNQLAHAVASAIARTPGGKHNPFFIYGGVGVGKTHLMQAVGNSLIKNFPALKVAYCSSETFTNELIESIQNRKTSSFRARYRKLDLLLIDDIQFIAGRESTQEEFFHTFNHLYAAGKQIILTSDREPSQIKKLEERLASRFAGGMIADIQNPEIDLREAILLTKAKAQSEDIDQEVIRFLAEESPGSVRDLEGSLVRLVTRSKMTSEKIDLELAKKIIGSKAVRSPLDSRKLISSVASFFSIKVSDLKGPSRTHEFVFPRQIAMYLMREVLKLSYEKIASELNRKDHTTVIYGVDKIAKEVENSPEVASWLFDLREQLGA